MSSVFIGSCVTERELEKYTKFYSRRYVQRVLKFQIPLRPWATAEHRNSIAESFPPYKHARLVCILVVKKMNTVILICYCNEMDRQRWSINREMGHRGAAQNPGIFLQEVFFSSNYIRLCTISATVHIIVQYKKQNSSIP